MHPPEPGLLGELIEERSLHHRLHEAQLAAALGLPYAFASHFAPDLLMQALAIYRRNFTPSEQLERAYAIVATNVIAAASPSALLIAACLSPSDCAIKD